MFEKMLLGRLVVSISWLCFLDLFVPFAQAFLALSFIFQCLNFRLFFIRVFKCDNIKFLAVFAALKNVPIGYRLPRYAIVFAEYHGPPVDVLCLLRIQLCRPLLPATIVCDIAHARYVPTIHACLFLCRHCFPFAAVITVQFTQHTATLSPEIIGHYLIRSPKTFINLPQITFIDAFGAIPVE